MTVDGDVPPEHVDHVILVHEGGGGLRRLFVQDVSAGRVTGAPALVALALPGRTGGKIAVLTAHLLGGRPMEAEHPPRLPALLAARVRTLAPRVRQPAVIVRCSRGRHRRREDAGPLLRARSLRGRWPARGRVAPLVVGHRVPAPRIGAVPPAAHPPVLRARAARHRTRRPLRRLPPVHRRGLRRRRRRRRGCCRGGGRSRRSGARYERPARLLGRWFYQSVALHSRQYDALVVLALHLPMLVSLATRDVALYGRANKQSGTQTLIAW